MDVVIVNENWVDILGYEGIYKISDLGNIKRIKTKKGCCIESPVKPWVNSNGYCAVGLSVNSKVKTLIVHRLVYKSFIGDPKGLDVCHNNGVRTDNRLSNLRADTRKGNMSDVYKHDTHIRGERCGTNKYSQEFITEFKKNIVNFKSIRQAAMFYKIPIGTAYGITQGRTWNWL